MSGGLELQAAAVSLLQASVPLQALIGDPVRLYMDVAAGAAFPYVTVGESQEVADLAECVDGWEIYLTFHVWSRAPGFAEMKEIAAALDDVLHNAELAPSGNRCLLIERVEARFMTDPDGATRHGVVEFRALVEPV